MSFPNPDNYARDCDCGTAGANTTPPPATIQSEINSLDTRITALEETNDVIVSSGGIANLTTEQQALIREGSIVVTTDGKRWVYSGTGSKTLEGSYIQLADITPVSPLVFENGGTITMTDLNGSAGYINTSGDDYGQSGGYIDTSATNGGSSGGYINTSGSDGAGGYIDTRGRSGGYGGGYINTSASNDALGGSINTSGGNNGAGGSINTSDAGGSINTSGGLNGNCNGGSINTSGGPNSNNANGGAINTSGGQAASGGSINTSGGSFNSNNVGGSINTSGGGTSAGGSLTTYDGGGSINTRGTGSIELGVLATRTTLNGSATSARTITLPNASGTLALVNSGDITAFLPKLKPSTNLVSVFCPGATGAGTGPSTNNRRFALIYLPYTGAIDQISFKTYSAAPNNINVHLALWNVASTGLPGTFVVGGTVSTGTATNTQINISVSTSVVSGFYYVSFTPQATVTGGSIAALNLTLDGIYGSVFGKSDLTATPNIVTYTTATAYNQTTHETFVYSNSSVINMGVRYV